MNANTAKRPGSKIVVGVDGSDSSKKALEWATRLAPLLEATITVVVAWEYPIAFGMEGALPRSWQPDETARLILKDCLDSVFGENRPDGLQGNIAQGNAIHVLLDASQDAQMLILGSRGLGGFSGLLLGSVSTSCAEHAKCPVLVVH